MTSAIFRSVLVWLSGDQPGTILSLLAHQPAHSSTSRTHLAGRHRPFNQATVFIQTAASTGLCLHHLPGVASRPSGFSMPSGYTARGSGYRFDPSATRRLGLGLQWIIG